MKNDNMRTRKKLHWAVFVFLAFILFPSLGKAEDEVLTLDLAIQMALTRNEQALTADQQIDVANAQVVRARAFFLPNDNGNGNLYAPTLPSRQNDRKPADCRPKI